jgi:hypothetical protein
MKISVFSPRTSEFLKYTNFMERDWKTDVEDDDYRET